MVINIKSFILLSCFFITSCTCNSKFKSNIEGAKIQTRVIPAVINSDEKVFIEALKVEPNPITKRIYDGAVYKGLYLQLAEHEVGNNYELEQDAHVNEINSLCIMGKFLLSPQYEKADKPYMQEKNYQDFFKWLRVKQPKWEKELANTHVQFNNSCLNIKN